MLAQSLYPHKDLQNLNGSQLQDKMMIEKNINWNDLEVKFKRGTYVKRTRTSRPFTADELLELPKKHKAQTDPNFVIERNIIKEVKYPIFNKIENQVDVVFFGAEPVLSVKKEEVYD
jgi:hypothetical protein